MLCVDFNIKKDKQKIAGAFFKRVCEILKKESVKYEDKVVAEVVTKYFPDFRRTLNELQRYASTGQIDSGILSSGNDFSVEKVVGHLRKKEFTNMKKWVAQNMDNEPQVIMRKIYDNLYNYFDPKSIPEAVLIISEYQYKSSFVVDQEINLVAFMTELMMRCEYK